MKKLNPILKSVIVLSCIAVVCVALLAVCNSFFSITEEERFARGMSDLIKADSFETVYDKTSKEPSKINDFNASVPSTMLNGNGIDGSVTIVYKAIGGEDNGKYVIESEAKGYKDYIKVYTALFSNGTVYGISIKEMGSGESFANKLNIPSIGDSLKNQSAGDIEIKTSNPTSSNGAAFTHRGIVNAVNLSAEFYKRVVLNVAPQEPDKTETVGSGTLKNNLNALLALVGESADEYTKYNTVSTTNKTYTNGRGRVATAYVSNNGHVILDVRGSYETYGACSLLALMDTDNNTILALKRVSGGEELADIDEHSYNINSLFADSVLNDTFANKTIDELFPMSGYINNTTGATQSNNGLKGAVNCALDKLTDVLNQIELVDQELAEGENE